MSGILTRPLRAAPVLTIPPDLAIVSLLALLGLALSAAALACATAIMPLELDGVVI